MINFGEKFRVKDVIGDRFFWGLVDEGQMELPFTIPDPAMQDFGIDASTPAYAFRVNSFDDNRVVIYWHHRDVFGSRSSVVPADFELTITELRTEIKVFVVESPDPVYPPMTCQNLKALQDGLEGFLGESGEWADLPDGQVLTIHIKTMTRKELAQMGDWEPR